MRADWVSVIVLQQVKMEIEVKRTFVSDVAMVAARDETTVTSHSLSPSSSRVSALLTTEMSVQYDNRGKRIVWT